MEFQKRDSSLAHNELEANGGRSASSVQAAAGMEEFTRH